MSSPIVRPAQKSDIDHLVGLCEQAQHELESYNDGFYASSPQSSGQVAKTLLDALANPDGFALVHESELGVDGLICGPLFNAPPVYAPGGKVAFIDHFVVAKQSNWTQVGKALINASDTRIKELGGVLSRIECRHNEKQKRTLLASISFTIASDWYYRDTNIPIPAAATSGDIEIATAADAPAIVELGERRRLQYQRYQPVFWRKAADSAEKQTPYIEYLIKERSQIVLVHKSQGKVDGFVTLGLRSASPQYVHRGDWCSTDDFTVREDQDWHTVGAALLADAVAKAKSRGANFTQAICGHADEAKSRMLQKMGYAVGHEWFVRSIN